MYYINITGVSFCESPSGLFEKYMVCVLEHVRLKLCRAAGTELDFPDLE